MSAAPDCREVEADVLGALMVPARQGDYRRNSRAFVRIDTSLRVYWHTLFDICPELLAFSGPDGLAVFRPFMAWAAERQLSMNWTYYLWVYRWLLESEFADRLGPELSLSLISASAARWATGDRSRDCGIAIGCSDRPDLIVGWKCRKVDGGRVVQSVTLETPLPPPEGAFRYFLMPEFALSYFPGWTEIPR